MAKKKDDKEEKKPTVKKKKGKVGRPKKRGRKKKYYKKKKKSTVAQGRKGFGSNVSYNRVRSLLWKEHKDEFASYRDFISNKVGDDGKKIKGSSIVSKVYDECKSLDCSDEDILIIYRQSTEQSPDDDKPLLPSDYYEPRPYWHLLTEDLWDGMDERLWVEAPMLIVDPSSFLGVLGEDRCVGKNNQILPLSECEIRKDGERVNKDAKRVSGKKNRFQPFVDYCNDLQAEATSEGLNMESGQVPHVRFVGQNEDDETYWNPIDKQWEVELIICKPSGDRYDYDFDPSKSIQDIDIDSIPEPEELVEKEDKVEDKEIDKEIELEKEKRKTSEQEEKTAKAVAKAETQKAVADITAQWRKGEITKKEMMELIKIIKS